MKVLEKTVELGEMSFKVRTNRDIAVKSFEEFPDVLEYCIKQEKKAEKGIAEILKNKGLSEIYRINDEIAKMVKFALPLMLKAADDKSNAVEIIEYATDNGVIDQFNAGILEFVAEGFTQGELVKKPKIKFSMK